MAQAGMAQAGETAIAEVRAREILDSRGNPTVEADVRLAGGGFGRAAAPSGASTGSHEAVERRDGDASRYGGRGVLDAVAAVEGEIAAALAGQDASDQAAIDGAMIALDGTEQKSRLGANALLAVSMASAKAVADANQEPLYRSIGGADAVVLPVPLANILNGGAHADQGADFQEFMVAPIGAETFAQATQMAVEVYHALASELRAQGLNTGLGDEGGFAPSLPTNESALDLIIGAIRAAGYSPGRDIAIALDPAASELWSGQSYELHTEDRSLSSAELTELWRDWCERYPIVSIEDGMDEDDWDGWRQLTSEIGSLAQTVGDDLLVTISDASAAGDRVGGGEQHPDQGQPDRHAERDAGGRADSAGGGLDGDHQSPLGGDRGHDDRGPGCGDERGADQAGRSRARGADGQVQPTAQNRGGVGGAGGVRGRRRDSAGVAAGVISEPSSPRAPLVSSSEGGLDHRARAFLNRQPYRIPP